MDAWALLMFLGSSICHQLPERSYFLGDLQMPLCARCIGIHLGFLFSASFLVLIRKSIPWRLPSLGQVAALGLVMTVFIVDAVLSYSGMSESTNLRRTISGLALGVPLPLLLLPMLRAFLTGSTARTNILRIPAVGAAVPVLYALALGAITLSEGADALFVGVSIAGVVGMVLFLVVAFSTMLSVLLDGWQTEAWTKVGMGSALAAVMILALAGLRDWLYPVQ